MKAYKIDEYYHYNFNDKTKNNMKLLNTKMNTELDELHKKNLFFGKQVLRFINKKPIKGVVVRSEKKRKFWYLWIIWENFEITGNDWEEDLIRSDYIREDKI